MEKVLQGKAFVFGANIDTDQIYPGRFLEITNPEEVGKHAMEGADPDFCKTFTPGGLIIAATNFGCGSSREHAAVTLKAAGVGAVLAESFGRIFYRNAINLGIPLLVCPGIAEMAHTGDVLTVDLDTGKIVNQMTGATAQAELLTGYALEILESGGIKELIRRQREV